MAEKLIRQVHCDRCGCSCSSYIEIEEPIADGVKKKFEYNVYHYTKAVLKGIDSRLEYGTDEFIFCGKCVDSLGKWLKERDEK